MGTLLQLGDLVGVLNSEVTSKLERARPSPGHVHLQATSEPNLRGKQADRARTEHEQATAGRKSGSFDCAKRVPPWFDHGRCRHAHAVRDGVSKTDCDQHLFG
jgi:hypothetical protein